MLVLHRAPGRPAATQPGAAGPEALQLFLLHRAGPTRDHARPRLLPRAQQGRQGQVHQDREQEREEGQTEELSHQGGRYNHEELRLRL